MTLRNPLVFVPGGTPVIQELPSGDSISGSTPGSVGAQGPTGSTGSQGAQGATGAAGSNGSNGTNGAMSQLAQVICASSQSTIHFASISGGSTNLLVVISGRDTATGSTDLSIRMKINSDATSGNYTSTQYILGSGSSASANTQAASAAGGICCQIPGSSGNANAVGGGSIMLPNYANTTFHKIVIEDSFELHSAGPTMLRIQRAFVWKNTAAITDLVLTAGGTAFVDGTTATLYGF